MSETGPSDQQIHALFAKFDASIADQASHILWAIWRHARPQYSTFQACLDTISEDVKLCQALQEAHSSQNYDVIRNWSHSLESSTRGSRDSAVQAKVETFLNEIEHGISQVVDGHISMPLWSPEDASLDTGIRCHLQQLRIPALKGKPNLLLHDLGSCRTDAVLSQRLGNIFMPDNHTFLVNTSGSGKTRLLLEGLCDNWGFYFTSFVDSSLLGSSDVQNSIQTHIPDTPNFRPNLPPAGAPNYDAALKSNRSIASNVFRRIFLARLLIFSCFAEIMESHRAPLTPFDIYRQRWLLLQLQPSLVHPTVWDIFDHLSGVLSQASDKYINTRTKELLQRVRELCTCDSSANPKQTPFFCVLDEAQYAASQHTTSFRSDHDGSHRPILREIVRAWERQSSGQGVFVVVAGTGISKDVVDQAMASAIMKDSKYRWCSDTGAFDEIEVQQRYLKKYLPSSLLESEPGRRLLDRIWYWLHGRHRFTAGYVMELIRNSFRQPHKLLSAYVKHFTGFSITDACDYVEDEEQGPLPMLSQYTLDFSKLKKNSDMLGTIHQVTTHYLMRSILRPLGGDEAMYVQYGFARFLDSETQVIAINEPLILLAAIRWMNSNHQSNHKILAREIDTHCPTFNGFENYIVYCIDLVLSRKHRLNEVFTFCGTQPAWADMEAELVALHRSTSGGTETGVASFQESVGPSITLGANTKSPESTLSWLKHSLHSPFCFPHHAMGPDAIFVLRLSDGTLIWVALQTKWSKGERGNLAKRLVLQAMRSVTPSKYFLDKKDQPYSPVAHPTLRDNVSQALLDLPNRRNDSGKYSLLRVIASFPARARLQRYIERDPDEERHPIAALNMNLIKKLTQRLPPQDFLERQETHTEVQSPARGTRSQKRNAPERGSERRKKIKLN